MDKKAQVEQLTTYMANFVSYIGKVLPDDIKAKIDELAEKEDSPLSKVIYQTMQKNQVLAKELNRPSCQDTGVLQFWVKCGTNFPLIGELEGLLKEAVVKATFEAPLRHNSVETFDEYNTGKNVGKGTPTVFWISYRTVISAKSIHTWQVADVHCQEKLWFSCRAKDTKELQNLFLML